MSDTMDKQVLEFNPGFGIYPAKDTPVFLYDEDVFGPDVENRRLDDIRKSLKEPTCGGTGYCLFHCYGCG